MFDILELLVDYSLNYKQLDRNFFDHVLSYYWNGSKNFLEKVTYRPIKENGNYEDIFVPMGYLFYSKEIIIDEQAIQKGFINRMLKFQMLGFDSFNSMLGFNSELLYDLLHEIDHSEQFRMGISRDKNFENLLYHLCFYGTIEILARGDLRRFIYMNTTLGNNTSLWDIFKSLGDVNTKFNRLVPYERIGQITASKKVLGLLEVLNADMKKIPDLLEYYKHFVYDQYILGYDESKAPLIAYLDAVKELDKPKLNRIVSELEKKIVTLDTVDDRFKYGLPVSNSEKADFKRRMLK